jgi:hypothetical protein
MGIHPCILATNVFTLVSSNIGVAGSISATLEEPQILPNIFACILAPPGGGKGMGLQ